MAIRLLSNQTIDSTLDLTGRVKVSGSSADQYFYEGARAGVGVTFSLYDNANNIYFNGYSGIVLRANQIGGSGGSIVLSGGNVGVGIVPAASVALDVKEPDTSDDLILGLTAGTGARAQIRSVVQSADTESVLSFHTTLSSSTQERLRILATGALSLGNSGTNYGTAGQVLTSSGNSVPNWSTPTTGTITGSGTANKVTKFTSATAIGDGPITFATNDATFAGTVKTTGASMGTTQADGDYIAKLYTASADGFLELFTGEGTPVSRIKLSSYGDSYFAGADTGRVGIGTATPDAKLDVKRGLQSDTVSIANSAAYLSGQYVGIILGQSNSGPYGTWIQSIRRIDGVSFPLSLNPSGSNVGIGTTSPDRTLDVEGTGMAIFGTGDYTELMLRGQVEGTGTVRNVGAFHWSIRGDVGGDNDDLKLLRFVTGTYSGIVMQIQNSTGNVGIESLVNANIGNLSITSTNNDASGLSFKVRSSPSDPTNSRSWMIHNNYSAAGNLEFLSSTTATGNPTTPRLTIDSSGNVGVNDTNPSGAAGYTYLTINNASNGAAISFKESGTEIAAIYYTNSSNLFNIYATETGSQLVFGTNAAERMRIDSSGNVGIGTTSPSYKLHVENTNAAIVYVKSTVNNQNASIWFNSNVGGTQADRWEIGTNISAGSDLEFFDRLNSVSRMVIQNDGNVGIGTISPTAKLHLAVSSANDDTFHIFNGSVRTHLLASESTNGVIYMRSSANTNTVRINSSGLSYFNGGNVGIGTTLPSEKLEVNDGNIFVNGENHGLIVDSVSKRVGFMKYSGHEAYISRVAGQDFGIVRTAGSNIEDGSALTTDLYIKGDGNVGIGNTNPSQKLHVTGSILASSDVVAFSDIKLKENIKTLDGSKVYDMHGVSFTRKDTGKNSSGVIAQEIQKIAPELITDNDGTLSVAYGNLTGYLIEAIKELKAKIEKLENKNCACKG